MEVFTEDSQNRPLVFCVRELPPGMPTGGDLREPIRVAGFFFKSWRYRTCATLDRGEMMTVKSTPSTNFLLLPCLLAGGRCGWKSSRAAGKRPSWSPAGYLSQLWPAFGPWPGGLPAGIGNFGSGRRRPHFRYRRANRSMNCRCRQSETPMNMAGPSASDTRILP